MMRLIYYAFDIVIILHSKIYYFYRMKLISGLQRHGILQLVTPPLIGSVFSMTMINGAKLFRHFCDVSHDFPDFVSVALALHPRFTLDLLVLFLGILSLITVGKWFDSACSAQFYKLSLLKQNCILYNSKLPLVLIRSLVYSVRQVNPIVSVVWTPDLPLVSTSSERITGSPQRFKKFFFNFPMVLCYQSSFFDSYERLLTDSYYHQCRELFVRDFTRRDLSDSIIFVPVPALLFLPTIFKFRRPGYGFVTFEKLLRP